MLRVDGVLEDGVEQALQLRGAAAVLQHLLGARHALLGGRGPRLVVEVVGGQHGLVEAPQHGALILQELAQALNLAVQVRQGPDDRPAGGLLGRGAVGQGDLLAQEKHELHRIGQVLQRHERGADAAPANARRAAGAVDEELGAGREVKVQHVVKVGDVYSARGHVRRHEDAGFVAAEACNLISPSDLVHGTVDDRYCQPKLPQEVPKELNVVSRRDKHDG
mmetsp:Transcript_99444/g.310479  ORF Transcript_99444/g.310479 Transcript_99444/m.310479 type:complete len:221 (+) Transcript_99444:1418-2080(+)